MRKVGIGLCTALLACLGMVVAAQAEADSAKTVQGELIDMYCYSAGGATGEGHSKCATKCMSSGIPAGILVDGQAWTLATNPVVLAKYAAKTIRVTGEMDEKTHIVLPKTIEVSEDGKWEPVKLKDAHHGKHAE